MKTLESLINPSSFFRGYVHHDKSKCLIALATDAKQVKLFERTLIGGFSSVNTRLAFEFQILLSKNEADDFTLIYDAKINNIKQKKGRKRITIKILKMDENNQYGNAMTKSLPYGCIKNGKTNPFVNLTLF